jgi:hypothetical protein
MRRATGSILTLYERYSFILNDTIVDIGKTLAPSKKIAKAEEHKLEVR